MDNALDPTMLMQRANRSFRTVRGTLRVWRDHQREFEAWKRDTDSHPRSERAGIALIGSAKASARRAQKEHLTEEIRIWLERPSRMREEIVGAIRETTVVDGQRGWTDSPELGPMAYDEGVTGLGSGAARRLFEPGRVVSALNFAVADRDEFLGRPAIRVRAKPRRFAAPDERTFDLGQGADEYELTIDVERGVLLRTAAFLDGRPFSITEVTEIAFDESLDSRIFQLQPSAAEPIRAARESLQARPVSLEDAITRASFQLWIPDRFSSGPSGANARKMAPKTDAIHILEDKRSSTPEVVYIRFSHYDGEIELLERQAMGSMEERRGWERVEEAEGLYFLGPPDMHAQDESATVLMVKNGTAIEVRSRELSHDKLLDVARSLVHASDVRSE